MEALDKQLKMKISNQNNFKWCFDDSFIIFKFVKLKVGYLWVKSYMYCIVLGLFNFDVKVFFSQICIFPETRSNSVPQNLWTEM